MAPATLLLKPPTSGTLNLSLEQGTDCAPAPRCSHTANRAPIDASPDEYSIADDLAAVLPRVSEIPRRYCEHPQPNRSRRGQKTAGSTRTGWQYG